MYQHMNFTGKGFIGSSEVKTANGTKFATIRLGVNNTWKNKSGEVQTKAHWFSCVTFIPKLIEMIEKGYFAKGKYVEVSGDLRDNRWKEKDGEEHFGVQVLATRIRFLERKDEGADAEMGEPEAA